MTRGTTGWKHTTALPEARVALPFEDPRDPSRLIHARCPRCVVTTSNALANMASYWCREARSRGTGFRVSKTISQRRATVAKTRCLQCFSSQSLPQREHWPTGVVFGGIFLYLTPTEVFDNHPALLKMFDRTQAANNLTQVVSHQ
jgi:hypothetical protein